MRVLIVISACIALGALADDAARADEPLAAPASPAFDPQVARILVARCLACHNASDPSGGLDLTSRDGLLRGGDSGEVLDAADPENGLLLSRVRELEMPPPEKAPPLAPEERETLLAWARGGGAWPAGRVLAPDEFTTDRRAGRDWWSLQPIQRPAIPPLEGPDAAWARTPIDAFVAAKLRSAGLTPSAEADRAALLRRLKFDLLGLPPTPGEIEAFLADDSPEAYEQLVERYLASPHYGERWGRHWLDVARYADSHGFEMNNPRPNAWPYRDWVIAALNADLPFDQFVRQQIAGDQLGAPEATGFLVAGPWDQVKSPDPILTAQQRMDELSDMVGTTGLAFLGLSVGCAKCHDHKFDPISQHDYYALQASLAGVEHGARELPNSASAGRREEAAQVRAELAEFAERIDQTEPLATTEASAPLRSPVNAQRNVDRFAPVEAKFVRFTILATSSSEPCLDELEIFAAGSQQNLALAEYGAVATASGVFQNGQLAIHQLAHVHDGRYGNDRSWIAATVGAGWVRIELPQLAAIDRVVWSRDRERKFTDRLATRYRVELSGDGEAWQEVANSDDRAPVGAMTPARDPEPDERASLLSRRQRLEAQLRQLDAADLVYAGQFKQPAITRRLHRGDPAQPREETPPGAIASLGRTPGLALDAPEAERRRALAEWLADARHPLPARVIVNRLWHYHFGQGLVATPGDFGWHGGRPSHPELLDWLASELIDSGGSLKHVQRWIVASSVFRQASLSRASALAIDADNRWLWRFAPRRLEAEPLRDAMLAVSGQLDARMGGPGYSPFEPNDNYVRVYAPRQRFGPSEWRRMVYQHKPRMRQDGTFGAFDCPDAGGSMSKRTVSTTALQAMNLLNSPFVVQQAALFAERLRREAGDDPAAQVARAFWLALGRGPSEADTSESAELVKTHGLPALCRALFNSNEFLYVQ